MLTGLVAFVPVAAVVICTPGPDTALTIRNALTGGRAAGGPDLYVGLLPQFAGTGRASLVAFPGFGFLFCLLTFGWLTVYSLVVARARALFDRPRVRRCLDALTGCVLIGLGVRLAAGQR